MAASEAQKRATRKYEAANYWKYTIRLKKELHEQLVNCTTTTVNAFIVEAITEKIARMNAGKD